MMTPHVSFRRLSFYAVLALAFLGVWVLVPDWEEGARSAVSIGQIVLERTSVWLLGTTSRLWLIASVVALGAFFLCGYISLRKRVIDVELCIQAMEFENLPTLVACQGTNVLPVVAAHLPAAVNNPPQAPAVAKTNGVAIIPAIQKPKVDRVPEPFHQMEHILKVSQRARWLRVKPALPCSPWHIGAVCHKGHVRSENQDYALAFVIGGREILVVADGCGGIPNGGRAAHLAAVAAARSIINAYGKSVPWYACDPHAVAAQALQDASLRLAREGARLRLVNPQDGLRTTLVVVVAQSADVGFAYCGDGGACIVRTSGAVEHFLNPQKAGPDQPNVLAASLGPQMQGEPMLGTIRRNPGDLLLVGTDGVFDRVELSFPKDVLRAAIQFGGDLDKTAKLIVEELTSSQDEAGYICDDNATLAIAGDGTQPILGAGFWNAGAAAAVKIAS